ncbi:MAG: hypothetical protein LBD29_05400 [Treponema sp.]|nr:hypothetical protein [Treponema sp.]
MDEEKSGKNRHNPPQIFDRVFKRTMRLSSMAIIQFINGLLGTDHSPRAGLEYLSTDYIIIPIWEYPCVNAGTRIHNRRILR